MACAASVQTSSAKAQESLTKASGGAGRNKWPLLRLQSHSLFLKQEPGPQAEPGLVLQMAELISAPKIKAKALM